MGCSLIFKTGWHMYITFSYIDDSLIQKRKHVDLHNPSNTFN